VKPLAPEVVARFERAVGELDPAFPDDRLDDENAEDQLRHWLDGSDEPMPWTHQDRVTEDEWFFITTMYGEMTLSGQRSHIRRFFPALFVEAANRDIRNFVPDLEEFKGLRSAWMSQRLCRMGEILRERGLSMPEYTKRLRRLELVATPENPMPALDAIVMDHRATGWKTLSVFVRDCAGGNCFPIDSRVQRELDRWGLPADERQLVRLALAIGRNPRWIARMFYESGGRF
jgi:hypothetical protein